MRPSPAPSARAALLASGRVAPSSSAQAEVLAALPALHRTAWQLLGLLCVLCGGVMLPLLLPACRLVNEHLRRWVGTGGGVGAGGGAAPDV